MSRFLSSKYEDLEPYTPGEQPKNMKKLIKLNTNENPYDPAPEVLLAINNEEIEKLRLYSDPEAAPLIEAAAGFYGVGRDMVMAGNGSDEVLERGFFHRSVGLLRRRRDDHNHQPQCSDRDRPGSC